MEEIIFRFATTRDQPAVREFLKSNHLIHQDIRPAGLKNFLLALDGTDTVGLVGLEIQQEAALLRSLAVKEGYRNQGLATILVSKIETYASTLGIKALYLLTETAADFFLMRDYHSTQRQDAPAGIQDTAEFKELCPASATFMVKRLTKN